MKKVNLYAWAFFLCIGIAFTGCKKREEKKSDTESAEDNATAEESFNDVFSQADDAAGGNSYSRGGARNFLLLDSCTIVTYSPDDSTTFPKTITIDYGAGCTSSNGKTRKGKIIVTLSGRYRSPGTNITITPQDYYVNETKVEGTKTIDNNGPNAAGHTTFTITVTGAKITTPEKVITWESARTREWMEGEITKFNILDDVYHITGTASGTGGNEKDFNVTIVNPLVIKIGCRWITQGSFDLEIDDYPTRTVDYGDGVCDNAATVKIKDKTFNITLK